MLNIILFLLVSAVAFVYCHEDGFFNPNCHPISYKNPITIRITHGERESKSFQVWRKEDAMGAILHIMREFENPDCTDSGLQQNDIGIDDQKDDSSFERNDHITENFANLNETCLATGAKAENQNDHPVPICLLTKARELFDAAIESFLGSQFGFFPLYKRYKPESNQQFRAETPDDPTPTFQKAIDDLLKVSAQCKCIASSFSIQAGLLAAKFSLDGVIMDLCLTRSTNAFFSVTQCQSFGVTIFSKLIAMATTAVESDVMCQILSGDAW